MKRPVNTARAALFAAAICLLAACDRSHPYDGAPNYSTAECMQHGGAVELPSSDAGFQTLVDEGCPHTFLGYAIVQGQQTAVVGLCCSL